MDLLTKASTQCTASSQNEDFRVHKEDYIKNMSLYLCIVLSSPGIFSSGLVTYLTIQRQEYRFKTAGNNIRSLKELELSKIRKGIEMETARGMQHKE